MLRSFSALSVLLLSLAAVSGAHAAQRTFVSTSGSDANTASNCASTAPCRGFGAALTVTDSAGEIIVLSSGGYGPVTLDKSVSIIAPEGVYAGVSVFSGTGITIATAGVDITLQGLTINGLGGTNGIAMAAGNSLTVRNCTIKGFPGGYGVYVTGAIQVRLFDSQMHGSGYGAAFAHGPTALVSGSRFFGNNYGVWVISTGSGVVTKVEVNRSEASNNAYEGFGAISFSSARSELNVKDSVASRNGDAGVFAYTDTGTTLATVSGGLISGNAGSGLYAYGSGAKLVATGNTVTRNGFGLTQDTSAVLQSIGDNTVTDNITAPTSGTITSLAKM